MTGREDAGVPLINAVVFLGALLPLVFLLGNGIRHYGTPFLAGAGLTATISFLLWAFFGGSKTPASDPDDS